MVPLIVIGAGAGGLVIAIGHAKAGRQVLLVDKGTWGGDCTNFGCIPSKALIHAANTGMPAAEGLQRARSIVQEVRSHEDPAALNALGVETLEGTAHFLDPHTLQVGDKQVKGKQIVIATGSRPAPPRFDADHLTNETIFDLEEAPPTLTVIGGGPIGCELGQAFAKFGSRVTLLQRPGALLPREEPEAQAVVLQALQRDGIDVQLGSEITAAPQDGPLLFAAGRLPNVEALQLDNAGVATHSKGITIDAYGRTTAKHIWAVGDCAGTPPFTHMAEFHARAILTSLLLPGPLKKRLDQGQGVPRCTYTDPEVAAAGLTEAQAKERTDKLAIYHIPLDRVDRAICTGRTDGFIKVVTKKLSSQILGATIVAPRAGEMLGELTLAMQHKIPLRKLASLIHPYPTYSQGIRKAADLWLTQTMLKR